MTGSCHFALALRASTPSVAGNVCVRTGRAVHRPAMIELAIPFSRRR